jgi:hypothetical protein
VETQRTQRTQREKTEMEYFVSEMALVFECSNSGTQDETCVSLLFTHSPARGLYDVELVETSRWRVTLYHRLAAFSTIRFYDSTIRTSIATS